MTAIRIKPKTTPRYSARNREASGRMTRKTAPMIGPIQLPSPHDEHGQDEEGLVQPEESR